MTITRTKQVDPEAKIICLSKIKKTNKKILRVFPFSCGSTLWSDVEIINHYKNEAIGNYIDWFLLMALEYATNNRLIVVQTPEERFLQKKLNKRISLLKPHPCAFGFIKGKNTIQCAQKHISDGKPPELLIKIDIKNFFNSFSEAEIEKSFLSRGFGDDYVKQLVELCTHPVFPSSKKSVAYKIIQKVFYGAIGTIGVLAARQGARERVSMILTDRFVEGCREDLDKLKANQHLEWIDFELKNSKRLILKDTALKFLSILAFILKCGPNTRPDKKGRMLFQGGACSPTISNICFKFFDLRLEALSRNSGCTYTRYADDLCFSFSERRTTKQISLFINVISRILRDGGFVVNKKKVRVLGSGSAMSVVGFCINSGKPTISKRERDALFCKIKSLDSGTLSDKEVESIKGSLSYIQQSNPEFSNKMTKILEAKVQKKVEAGSRRISL